MVAGAIGDRIPGALLEVEFTGQRHDEILVDSTLFRERAARRRDDDLVADGKSRDLGANGGDDTRRLVTRNKGRRCLDLVLAGDHENVRKIDSGGGHIDNDLAGVRLRVVAFLDDQLVRRTECIADQRAHYASSNSDAAPWPPPMHIVQTTYFAPRRLPSTKACPTSLAPDMP